MIAALVARLLEDLVVGLAGGIADHAQVVIGR
jgi:hypothetical protein